MGRRFNPDTSPGGASAAWMAARPQVDWGSFMPDLSNQRRSENVEDVRSQPYTVPEMAYRYLGVTSSPAEVFSGMYHGLQHPFTMAPKASAPFDPVPPATPMGRDLGYDDTANMIKALRGN